RCELLETDDCEIIEAGWKFGRIERDYFKTLNNYTNIALNKPTYQISTFGNRNSDGKSGNAVDGNTDGRYLFGRSCSHTYADPIEQPWWIVDLGKSYKVLQIVIWNRIDCCSHRLHDFAIEIGCEFDGENPDSPHWSRKYLHNGTVENNPVSISFPENSVGRFIKINNAEVKSEDSMDDILTLCEVEVYADYVVCECEIGL
ncbi:unnamed protein product, partial [Owenia fusiformis]